MRQDLQTAWLLRNSLGKSNKKADFKIETGFFKIYMVIPLFGQTLFWEFSSQPTTSACCGNGVWSNPKQAKRIQNAIRVRPE